MLVDSFGVAACGRDARRSARFDHLVRTARDILPQQVLQRLS
jgi:hypothetical protein